MMLKNILVVKDVQVIRSRKTFLPKQPLHAQNQCVGQWIFHSDAKTRQYDSLDALTATINSAVIFLCHQENLVRAQFHGWLDAEVVWVRRRGWKSWKVCISFLYLPFCRLGMLMRPKSEKVNKNPAEGRIIQKRIRATEQKKWL